MPIDPIHPLFLRHPVSAGTHLLFCAWAVWATLLFRRLSADDRFRRACVTVFGLSMVVLYGASGLYHAIPANFPRLIDMFLRADLAAIHVLIAGTCTVMFAVLPVGRFRRLLLVLVWMFAAAGAASKALPALPPVRVTLALYVANAAVGCLPARSLARAVGPGGMAWIAAGALAYAAGATCDRLRWPVPLPGVLGPHEILHLCDMLGTSCHVVFVVRYVLRPFERVFRCSSPVT
jgi:hemolysin III